MILRCPECNHLTADMDDLDRSMYCFLCRKRFPPSPILGAAIQEYYEGLRASLRAIEIDEELATERLAGARKCAWPSCKNLALGRSQYCCRACSNKNARARYLERQATRDAVQSGPA